jgi:transposase
MTVLTKLFSFYFLGEVVIPQQFLQEFIDLCLEFNCDTIIDVENLVKTHKIETGETLFKEEHVSEWLKLQETNPELEIKKTEIPKQEIINVNDYFEANRNVEAIYLNEDGGGEIEQFLLCESKKEQIEEYLKKESDDDFEYDKKDFNDEDLISTKVERIAYRSPDGEGTNPLYDEQLKRACEDVIQNGISFLHASKKYGITRSVIHRHVQIRRKVQNVSQLHSAGPSGVKSDANNEKAISWWDATNPSWNTEPQSENKILKKSKHTKIKYKVDGTRGKNPEFVDNLKKAVDDVLKNGVSFWTAHKRYGVTRSVIHRHVQKIRKLQQESAGKKKKQKKVKVELLQQPPNIMQLREELNRFKERLQKAINACRNEGMHIKKASKFFDIPIESIERNLKGCSR